MGPLFILAMVLTKNQAFCKIKCLAIVFLFNFCCMFDVFPKFSDSCFMFFSIQKGFMTKRNQNKGFSLWCRASISKIRTPTNTPTDLWKGGVASLGDLSHLDH